MTDSLDRLKAALADRYAIEKEIGAGGMATVYLAEDLKHHRKVAVKVLRPELAAVLGAERFLKEIEVTANLQHPHVVPLFDSGEADTFLYYVMPFVEGESLRDRLNHETQLPIQEAVEIAKDWRTIATTQGPQTPGWTTRWRLTGGCGNAFGSTALGVTRCSCTFTRPTRRSHRIRRLSMFPDRVCSVARRWRKKRSGRLALLFKEVGP